MIALHRLLVVFAVVGLATSPASAQTIGGRVLDRDSRHPLPWLAVDVLDDTNAVLLRATTDSIGVFYAMLAGPARVHLRFGGSGDGAPLSDTLAIEAEAFVQRDFIVDLPPVYPGSEVEKPVSLQPGGKALDYPDELRKKDEPGEVVASFVVDTTGKAVLERVHILSTTHPAFIASVMKALGTRRYVPAEIGGTRVQQLVEQSFAFHVKVGPLPSRDAELAIPGAYIPRARP